MAVRWVVNSVRRKVDLPVKQQVSITNVLNTTSLVETTKQEANLFCDV
jgi:hypothetical protein